MSQSASTQWVSTPSKEHEQFYTRIRNVVLKEHNDLPLDQVIAICSSFVGYLVANSDDAPRYKVIAIVNIDNGILDATQRSLTKPKAIRKQIARRYASDDSSTHQLQ